MHSSFQGRLHGHGHLNRYSQFRPFLILQPRLILSLIATKTNPQDDVAETLRIKDFSRKLALAAQSYGGSCTGEHGIGLGKRELLIKEVGIGAYDTMKIVKKSLDPLLIMNPGKVIDLDHLL